MQPKVIIFLFLSIKSNINLALWKNLERDSQFNPNYTFNSFINYLDFSWALAAEEIAIYKIDVVPALVKHWRCAIPYTTLRIQWWIKYNPYSFFLFLFFYNPYSKKCPKSNGRQPVTHLKISQALTCTRMDIWTNQEQRWHYKEF